MRKQFRVVSLILVLSCTSAGARPVKQPPPQMTEEQLFRFLMGMMQLGSGASPDNVLKIETGTRDLARQRAAARREGIPLTPQEFQRPLPPPEQDAALIYAQLIRLRSEKPLDEKLEAMALRISSRHQYGPEEIAAARQLLSERRDMLTLVHQATDRPYCAFQKDWLQGPALQFPELAAVRQATRLLTIESQLLALDGHMEAAIANQCRGFRAASHIGAGGTMIAYLTGIACETITLTGLQDILYRSGPDPKVASRIRTAIRANQPQHSFRHALEGEVMMQVGLMHQCREWGPKSIFLLSGGHTLAEAEKLAAPWEQHPMGRRYWNLLADAGEADLLNKMRQAFAILQRPYPERARLAERWVQSIDRSRGVEGIFSAIALPIFTQTMIEKELHVRALRNVVMSGAAVLEYRAVSGQWPRRLDEAVSLVPVDPFTHRPLRYRREPGGFVIYNVGPGGKDDGGQLPAPRGPAKAWKSVFRYPAPPPQPALPIAADLSPPPAAAGSR